MNTVKSYALVAAALLALLILTLAIAYVNLGPLNTPIAMLISLGKAALIALFFMDLRRSSGLVQLFAAAGFFWFGIMVTLALSDFLTRRP